MEKCFIQVGTNLSNPGKPETYRGKFGKHRKSPGKIGKATFDQGKPREKFGRRVQYSSLCLLVFGLHYLTLAFLGFVPSFSSTFSVISLSICVGSLILDTICPVKLEFNLYLQYPMYDQQ